MMFQIISSSHDNWGHFSRLEKRIEPIALKQIHFNNNFLIQNEHCFLTSNHCSSLSLLFLDWKKNIIFMLNNISNSRSTMSMGMPDFQWVFNDELSSACIVNLQPLCFFIIIFNLIGVNIRLKMYVEIMGFFCRQSTLFACSFPNQQKSWM